MRRELLVLVGLATVVGGCGQASEEAADKAFDENFVTSCVSAAKGGMPTELATQACDCALDKINEQYTTSEKLTLSDDQAMPIAQQCFSQVMEQVG